MSKSIEEILEPKPEARPRIYAYSIADEAHKGLLKVGQTTRDVKQRIAEQLKTANIKNYTIELDVAGERDDGTIFSDYDVREALVKKRFENTELEWVRCSVKDVKTVLTELRTGQQFTGTHHETFSMRREQTEAVEKTFDYFNSIWAENKNAAPRFLWNAKMRFGKTFTTYQLAKKLKAKRVLVMTFKPAVADAWQTDLESHVDFDGWQFLSRHSDSDPTRVSTTTPLVYFGSLQDLLGRDKATGSIKPKNKWIHKERWPQLVGQHIPFLKWRLAVV
ncbi:MAG: GIY-YIG nuclease family protein [Nitrospira sp.]|nr:GIY-YIG nuclease family protein [Nitrospira sp.]